MASAIESDPLFVTIVTPSYQQGKFIRKTIESVQMQDYPHIEHIVVDGGSEDETLDILREYERVPHFRWVSEADKGQADAICKGFRMARGEILAWLNSDDVLLGSTVISEVAVHFRHYPVVQVITGGGVFIDKEDRWLKHIPVEPRVCNAQSLQYHDGILQPSTFFLREVMDSVSFDKSLQYVFDWDFFIQLFSKYSVLPVHAVWSGYRLTDENKTFTGGIKRTAEIVEVVGRYAGKARWQYWMLRFMYLCQRGASHCPESIARRIDRILQIMAGYLWVFSHRRFQW